MILITGATAGIGKATAQAFAQEKQNLFLIGRRVDRLESLKKTLTSEFGIEVHVAKLDVSDKNAVSEFAKKNAALLDKVTVLVNNAGLAQGIDPIQEANPDDWDVMINTNVKGLLYLTRAVVPHFLKSGKGHIVNLGSVAGHWVYPRGAVYCATKYAVKALNEGMRLDLHGTGIRVTSISPGLVETEFSMVRLKDKEKAEAVYKGLEVLQPADIAEAIVWATNRPRRVNVQEMILYPTEQASPRDVLRK